MRYIVENEARLVPLFDSDLALGGPCIPSISGESPIHYVRYDRILVFLLDHGADPWAPEVHGDGGNIFTDRSKFQTCCFQRLVKLPSFDPNYIDAKGHSYVDMALDGGHVDVAEILLDNNVPVTSFTHNLLKRSLSYSKSIHCVSRALALTQPDQLLDAVR